MRITKIEVQQKRKDRYNIYIDDEFRFGLDEGTIARLGLYEKMEIDNDLIFKIENEEVFSKAMNSSFSFLKARVRSRKEIFDKLKTKDYSDKIIDDVLNRLEELDFVNDEKFAQSFVSDRMKLKPKGKKILNFELKNKGISDLIIEKVLSENMTEEKEEILISGLLEKLERKYFGYSEAEKKEKTIKYLLNKGFLWDNIKKVVDK